MIHPNCPNLILCGESTLTYGCVYVGVYVCVYVCVCLCVY